MRQGGRRYSHLARSASPGRFLPKGFLQSVAPMPATEPVQCGDALGTANRAAATRGPAAMPTSSPAGAAGSMSSVIQAGVPRGYPTIDGDDAADPERHGQRDGDQRRYVRPMEIREFVHRPPSLPIESRGHRRRRRPTDGSTIPRTAVAKITQRKNKRRPVPGLVGTTCRGLNRADKICAHH
jgi:hypothetical protein